VPFEVPEVWVWTTLGEILELVSGQDFPPEKYNANIAGIPYIIGASNIENEQLIINRWTESPSVYSYLNDLLVVCKGAGVGKMAINNIGVAHIARQIQAVRGYTNYTDIKYIKAVVKNNIENIISKANGLIPGLKRELLLSLQLPLPPISEQRRIVCEIERWFFLIDQIEQGKADLQTVIKQAKSKILDLAIHGKLVPQNPNDEPAIELLKRINPDFTPCDNGHYTQLPDGWAAIKVGDVAIYINGRAFKPEDWMCEGLPIIRIQNLNDKNAGYNRTTKTYESKYLIHNGDLLFAWAASLGTYIWNGGNAWLNQHIFKVEPYQFIEKSYLYYIFKTMTTEFYAQSHGSGMVHITKKQFENIELLLPPLKEQKRIVQTLEQISTNLDQIVESL